MQIREDLQKEEMPPVWDTSTGECFYIKHTPTLDVEYIWSPDDGGELNDEGANTILKIRCGTGVHSVEGNYNHPKNLEEDLLVLAVSIDWEDKEHKTCVPEVPAPNGWECEMLHAKAHPKPKNIVRVWDVLFYLEDENGLMARDYKGRVQIFDAPDMDVSDIGYGVDVKDLRKHSVDE